MPGRSSPWMPYLLLTLTVLFWSGNFVLGRGIRTLIPPVSLNFWRWMGAGIILLPIGLPRILRQRDLMRRHWKMLALLSIPSISIFNAFIYTALQTTTTINTVLVNAMVPIFIALTARLTFGLRLARQQMIGISISFCGLIFLITRGDWEVIRHVAFSRGDLWTLGAGLAWAVYSVMLRRRPPQMDPVAFLTALIGFGLLFLLPFYLWELKTVGGFSLSPASLGGIAYVCIFPSVLAYIFWNHGVEQVGASRAGIFFHLMPAFSILLAYLFLGEALHLYHLFGLLLILGGIGLSSLPWQRSDRSRVNPSELQKPAVPGERGKNDKTGATD